MSDELKLEGGFDDAVSETLTPYPSAWIVLPDGKKVLNPVIASMLLERLQFDGDIVEGRNPGHSYPQGVLPAVAQAENKLLALDTLAGVFLQSGLRLLGDGAGEGLQAPNPITTTHGRDALSSALSKWVIRRLFDQDGIVLGQGRGHVIFDKDWRFDLHHPEHAASHNTFALNVGLSFYTHARNFLTSRDVGNNLLLCVNGIHDIPGRVVGWRLLISEVV